MKNFTYSGPNLREVRFPLGGIGAGCVSIDGGARLVDFEVHNRPNKDSYNGFTHIAVKAERDGQLLSARALNGPLQPPYMGRGLHPFGGYTYGPARETMCGVPHFDDVVLTGRFPVAAYRFAGDFPGTVSLRAWSPFEPGNDFDSSLPLAVFEVSMTNTEPQPIDYTAAFTLANPEWVRPVNRVEKQQRVTTLVADDARHDASDPAYGQMCVATDAANVSAQRNWYRGTWFDGLTVFWQDFCKPGPIKPRDLAPAEPTGTQALVCQEHGTLCVHMHAAPGETARARFAMGWYSPVCEKYWGDARDLAVKPKWRNWYATQFASAKDVTDYAFRNWDRLKTGADAFVDALYGATLPAEIIDAAGSTLAVLKSPTCLRLTDGSFYGWEGSHARDGSCEGSCQHVWNYQYALPMLFPNLERSMRELDFNYNLKPDGSMPFRLQLPLGTPPQRFRACADGQMGAIIKTYREWKLSGDTEWMLRLWPDVRRAMAYAWSCENPDQWDRFETGLLVGRQHHTLDMELFGENAWLSGLYLAALEAAARMADVAGDDVFAEKCRTIKARGMERADDALWNGEYFIQKIDVADRSVLEPYVGNTGKDFLDDVMADYWNAEAKEIKYQIAEGSSIDQLLGQWHADLCGLGELFDSEKVKTALASVFKYNYVPRMGEVFNPCRIYCLQDEAGLLICAYPEGKARPVISAPYAEETMHGFEYAAACHMILRGLVDEGLTCVKAVRDRYDGERRNPWNEIECGGNYARSMAAWSLVMAWQGLQVDMTEGKVSFNPIGYGDHRSLWAFGGAWGTVEIAAGRFEMKCLGGAVELKAIEVSGQPLTLDGPIHLRKGTSISA